MPAPVLGTRAITADKADVVLALSSWGLSPAEDRH